MAQKTFVQLTDDLTGTPLEDGQGGTVVFALDGDTYEIDLSKENEDGLRAALAPFVAAGRRQPKVRSATPTRRRDGGRKDLNEVREWARANGYNVSNRGRVAAEILAAYDAGH